MYNLLVASMMQNSGKSALSFAVMGLSRCCCRP